MALRDIADGLRNARIALRDIGRACAHSYYSVLRRAYYLTGGNEAGIFPVLLTPPREVSYLEAGGTSIFGSSILGVLGSIAANTIRSAIQTSGNITNLVLHEKHTLTINNNRRRFISHILGAPGFAIGLIAGFAGATAAFAGRTFANSVRSAALVVGTAIKKVLHKDQEKAMDSTIDFGKQDRTWKEHLLGLPGAVLSLVPAAIGAATVLAGRAIVNSVRSAALVTGTVIKKLLHKDQDDIMKPTIDFGKQDRTWKEHLLGLPGAVLSLVPAAIGAATVLAGRAIVNSVRSAALVTGTVIKKVLHKDQDGVMKSTIDFGKQDRTWKEHLLGLPGAALSLVPAAIGAATVLAGRTFANSVRSAALVTGTAIKKVLHQDQEDAIQPVIDFGNNKDPRHPEKKRSLIEHAFGLPGTILGLVPAAIGAATVLAGRTFANSVRSAALVTGTAIKKVLHQDQEDAIQPVIDFGNNKDPRHPEKKRSLIEHAFGLPGTILGLVPAAIGAATVLAGRAIVNSVRSAALVTGTVIKKVLHKDQDDIMKPTIDFGKQDRTWKEHLLGLPGAVLSLVPAAIGAATVLAGRTFANSVRSAALVTGTAIKKVLHQDQEDAIQPVIDFGNNKDPRHPEKKRSLIEHAFGLPGTILGLVPAAIGAATVLAGRTFANSVRSAALVTGTAIKKVLHQDQEDAIQPVIDFGNNKDPRHPEKKRSLIEHAFGLPGTILGLVPAAIGAAAVFAGRAIVNSIRSAALVTGTVIKKVLHKDQDGVMKSTIDFGKQDRTWKEHLLGLPGAALSLVPAAIGAATVLAGRTFANSVRSAALVTGTAIKKVLHQDQEHAIQPVIDFGNNKDPQQPDKKRSLIEHAFGLPGAVLSLVPAAIGAAAVFAGRTIANSVHSAALVTGTVIKKVLHKDQDNVMKPTIDFGKQDRTWKEHLLGLPGAVLSLVPAAIGAATVLAGRTFANSVRSAALVTGTAIKKVLHQDQEDAIQPVIDFGNNKDPRHPEKKRSLIEHAFGLPGTILGLVLAAIGAATVLAGRAIVNSVRSAALVTGTVIKKVLHKDQDGVMKSTIDFGKQDRTWKEHLLGLPGAALSLVPAAIGAATVFAGRAFANSVRSAALVVGTAIKKVLHKDQEKTMDSTIAFGKQDRTWSEHALGIPGVALSLLPAAIGAAAVFAGRTIANSVRSAALVTGTVIKKVLHKDQDNVMKPTIDFGKQDRTWKEHLLGLPGAVLSLVPAAIGAATVLAGRTFANSWATFKNLSGGIMNVALERQVFKGLSNKADNRWSFGLPGAVAALAITGSIALATTIFTKLIPLAAGLVFAGPTALIRGLREGYKAITNQLRFSDTLNQTQRRLKNLFATLNASGKFPIGKEVQQAQDSAHYTQGFWKNVGKLCRKAITFNTQTLTERLLTAIAENLGAKQDVATAVDTAKRVVHEYYQGQSDWFTPEFEKGQIRDEINRISIFIQGYLENGAPGTQIPRNLYRKSQTATLFLSQLNPTEPAGHDYQAIPKTP
ncbi:hypothetical protein [Piscirickettsia salmonis]|uniref:hypothetical protein n=1 Tax=Piscirickettsia salmonis TaxID=1238 RepID=UPI00064C6080|nr:hypothetical protein [Piscirickettsia salmonis]KLV35522.1 hypothetical protein AB894_08020 [Piscirickettsia salmonis]